MQTASTATHQVLKLKHLPPLSSTATRLLELLADEDLSLELLSNVISQDPGISARILGVANSAYFGQTSPIHSVEEAVIRVLGLNMVRSLSFSLAISGSFDTSRCHGFDLEAYWYHALATAALSRMICRHMVPDEQPDQDGIYLAGLLFDIGVLVLVHLFPEDYANVLHKCKGGPLKELSKQEEDLVGISSREAGGWILDRWHLPPMVVRVIRQVSNDTASETALVGMADLWVNHGFEDGQNITRDLLGVSGKDVELIQAEFLHQADEIRTVASLLAK